MHTVDAPLGAGLRCAITHRGIHTHDREALNLSYELANYHWLRIGFCCGPEMIIDVQRAFMRARQFVAIGFMSFLLSGCGIAARVDARNEYQVSAANYKACLAANPAAPQNCESLRLAMETDERKYNNLSSGLNPGSQTQSSVTILNR